MSTSTAGSTSRGLPAAIRRRSTRRSRSSTSALSRICSDGTTNGNIKPKNEWLHVVNWDLVVFDEYHFGAWRDTAKELFEGEDDAVAKKETKLEYAADLADRERGPRGALRTGDRVSADHDQGVPVSLRHAVQGAGDRRVHRGADLQLDLHRRTARPKRSSQPRTPGKWNPYAALPQMRLLTYQMPDELLAIASGWRVR